MAGELERLLIRIEADTAILRKALSDADKQIAGFGNNVDRQLSRTERRFQAFGNAGRRIFAGLSVAYLAKETVELADTYTNMANRLKFVTNSAGELEAVQQRLFQIAQTTRVDLKDTTELYSRMAFALRDTGASQNDVLRFTENLNKALTLSGAAGAEASGALIQLSQGLASGTLRGQELNSILEQTPYIATLIAKQLGVTTGELRALGMQGKITGGEVFKAITNASAELDAKFKNTVPTVAQGFTAVGNSLLQFVGDANEASGASYGLAKALQAVASGIDAVNESTALKKLREDPLSATPLGMFRDALVKPDQGQGSWEATTTPNLDAAGPATAGAGGESGFDAMSKQLEQLRIQALEANNLHFEALQAQHDMEAAAYQEMLDKKLISQGQFNDARSNLQTVSDARMSQEAARAWSDMGDRISDTMGAITGMMGAEGDKQFNLVKAASIATALLKARESVTSSYAAGTKLGGPPLGFAYAAMSVAATMAQIASLRSTPSSGGGGVSSGGGSMPTVAPAAQPSASSGSGQGQTLTVRGLDSSAFFDRRMVRELMEKLVEAQKDGYSLVIA